MTSVAAGCAGDRRAAYDVDVESLPALTLREELRLGSVDDPDRGFSWIGGIDVDGRGRLYVAETLDREIRVYDSGGRLERRIGGHGSGPAEFQSIVDIGIAGDRLWVRDMVARRNSVFTLGGALLRTVPALGVEVATQVDWLRVRVYPVAMMPDGRWLGGMTTARLGPVEGDSIRVPRLIFDSTGEVVDTAGFWILRPRVLRAAGVEVSPISALPQTPLRRPIQRDSLFVEREAAVDPSPSVGSIARVTTGGDTVWSVRFVYSPRAVDPAFVDSLVDDGVRRAAQGGVAAMAVRRVLRGNLDVPAYHPPVSDVQIGTGGSVWLRLSGEEDDAQQWLVVGPDGSPRGTLALPPTASVRVVTDTSVLVVQLDNLDIPYIVRYRVGQTSP